MFILWKNSALYLCCSLCRQSNAVVTDLISCKYHFNECNMTFLAALNANFKKVFHHFDVWIVSEGVHFVCVMSDTFYRRKWNTCSADILVSDYLSVCVAWTFRYQTIRKKQFHVLIPTTKIHCKSLTFASTFWQRLHN